MFICRLLLLKVFVLDCYLQTILSLQGSFNYAEVIFQQEIWEINITDYLLVHFAVLYLYCWSLASLTNYLTTLFSYCTPQCRGILLSCPRGHLKSGTTYPLTSDLPLHFPTNVVLNPSYSNSCLHLARIIPHPTISLILIIILVFTLMQPKLCSFLTPTVVGGDVALHLKFPTSFNGKMAVLVIIFHANTYIYILYRFLDGLLLVPLRGLLIHSHIVLMQVCSGTAVLFDVWELNDDDDDDDDIICNVELLWDCYWLLTTLCSYTSSVYICETEIEME